MPGLDYEKSDAYRAYKAYSIRPNNISLWTLNANNQNQYVVQAGESLCRFPYTDPFNPSTNDGTPRLGKTNTHFDSRGGFIVHIKNAHDHSTIAPAGAKGRKSETAHRVLIGFYTDLLREIGYPPRPSAYLNPDGSTNMALLRCQSCNTRDVATPSDTRCIVCIYTDAINTASYPPPAPAQAAMPAQAAASAQAPPAPSVVTPQAATAALPSIMRRASPAQNTAPNPFRSSPKPPAPGPEPATKRRKTTHRTMQPDTQAAASPARRASEPRRTADDIKPNLKPIITPASLHAHPNYVSSSTQVRPPHLSISSIHTVASVAPIAPIIPPSSPHRPFIASINALPPRPPPPTEAQQAMLDLENYREAKASGFIVCDSGDEDEEEA